MTKDQIAAIEEFAAQIKKYYTLLGGLVPSCMVAYYIGQKVSEYKNQGE